MRNEMTNDYNCKCHEGFHDGDKIDCACECHEEEDGDEFNN